MTLLPSRTAMTQSRPKALLFAVVFALAAYGCDDDPPADERVQEVMLETGGGAPAEDQIESLDQVDVARLGRSERRMWVELVNDLNSPCGEPISVAQCVSEERSCQRCVPAARMVARLANEGLDRGEIRDLYRNRYGADTGVELDLEGAPLRGAPMSPITIVEYSDFECPYCGRASPALHRIVREFEGQVRLVFKHFPLSGHLHSMPAARASMAAHRQGKFWEMHDLLFANQENLEPAVVERFAEELGLDMDRFHADIEDEDVQALIDANKDEGRRVGVDSTPTIFVNGRRYDEPVEAMAAYLQEELDQ